ncbi:MAG: alkaline phosphatase family protein [Xanthobacteraceae bacterium]|nr:alkaline phosphatase family protein [Xanthobacteraceae bacterium]
MFGKKTAMALGLAAALATTGARAIEGPVPYGVPHLDHVFVIMMENHGYSQIANNPFAPFINGWMKHANVATNYFAVAHPSLTNYLEVVGGSNFGVHSDNYPDWHNKSCTPNLVAGTVNTDTPASPNICPIAGTGTDAATPAIDTTNETQGLPGDINIDGTMSIPAATNISGKTIADQAVAGGLSWKSYQESLSFTGPDLVNYGDGVFDNTTPFNLLTGVTPPLTSANVVALYAAKHNPFVYFRNIQENGQGDHDRDDQLSYASIAPFDGGHGLYADLAGGNVPNYSFIAPNQCNDMHGRGNGTAFCNYDPNDNGTQAGLNPALIYQGDVAVEKLYRAIKASPAWQWGRNAIVLVFDENDYSVAPTNNRVLLLVDKNYGSRLVQSGNFYSHFSLLKSIEAGLRLPCLNHACDANVAVMSDLFAE